ncbi:hypothetical protein A2U01_0115622, partial [Trifolium medium]|nr:hypothetical protein [Trifolium medium]
SSKVVDPSRIMGSLYRAGLSTRCTEQECGLVVPSRSGFGPARGPVQNMLPLHSDEYSVNSVN